MYLLSAMFQRLLTLICIILQTSFCGPDFVANLSQTSACYLSICSSICNVPVGMFVLPFPFEVKYMNVDFTKCGFLHRRVKSPLVNAILVTL